MIMIFMHGFLSFYLGMLVQQPLLPGRFCRRSSNHEFAAGEDASAS
jgi:hypothetical protein